MSLKLQYSIDTFMPLAGFDQTWYGQRSCFSDVVLVSLDLIETRFFYLFMNFIHHTSTPSVP